MVYLHRNGSLVAVETYMNNLPQTGISTFKVKVNWFFENCTVSL